MNLKIVFKNSSRRLRLHILHLVLCSSVSYLECFKRF